MEGVDDELKKLIKVWILTVSSLTYCYYVSSKFPKGVLRLVSLVPVISVFVALPLNLSSIHLCGITSFFLVWLANFKLLLFAFDQPPLSQLNALPHFISIACLPIKFKTTKTAPPKSSDQVSKPPSTLLVIAKVLLLFSIFKAYDYRQLLHPNAVLALYCCHLYLELELVLALCAAPARALGFELEPQFNEPYLATSLQDFWGRRWNLMVTSILRPTVYDPIQRVSISTCKLGVTWARMIGVIAVFVVSGLMHEWIYCYLTRVAPTWEVTWFFVLHGVCVAIEVFVKKKWASTGVNGRHRYQLHRALSGALVMMFVAATGVWLFFAQIFRNKLEEKVLEEVFYFVHFIKTMVP